MGSCVPPKICPTSIEDFNRFKNSPEASVFKMTMADLQTTIDTASNEVPGPISLDFFETLSASYWAALTVGDKLPPMTDEYARQFCLETEVAQNTRVEKSEDNTTLIARAWGTPISIPIPNEIEKAPNAELFDGQFHAETFEQADNFLMYLFGSISDHLPSDSTRLGYLFEFIHICINSINHAVFQAKSLVKQPRPTLTLSLPLPATSSWPAGHAYICGATSAALFVALTKNLRGDAFSPARKEIASTLVHMSKRIGENRERAGLHFQEDTEAGFSMGFRVMAAVLMHAATTAPKGVSGEVTELCGYLNRALV